MVVFAKLVDGEVNVAHIVTIKPHKDAFLVTMSNGDKMHMSVGQHQAFIQMLENN